MPLPSICHPFPCRAVPFKPSTGCSVVQVEASSRHTFNPQRCCCAASTNAAHLTRPPYNSLWQHRDAAAPLAAFPLSSSSCYKSRAAVQTAAAAGAVESESITDTGEGAGTGHTKLPGWLNALLLPFAFVLFGARVGLVRVLRMSVMRNRMVMGLAAVGGVLLGLLGLLTGSRQGHSSPTSPRAGSGSSSESSSAATSAKATLKSFWGAPARSGAEEIRELLKERGLACEEIKVPTAPSPGWGIGGRGRKKPRIAVLQKTLTLRDRRRPMLDKLQKPKCMSNWHLHDTVLRTVDGGEVSTCKLLLAQESQVFAEKFGCDVYDVVTDSDHSELFIDAVDGETLKTVVEALHANVITLNEHNVAKVMHCAETLNLPVVRRACNVYAKRLLGRPLQG